MFEMSCRTGRNTHDSMMDTDDMMMKHRIIIGSTGGSDAVAGKETNSSLGVGLINLAAGELGSR